MALGYLPNYDEDVFISYAHNDDDVYASEPRGWVTQLHYDLEQRVTGYLGSQARLWRDIEIRNNEHFDEKISNRLAKTATLLSVISPSFIKRPWCLRELEEFALHAEGGTGIRVDEERSRIFKVEKIPIDRDALPSPMQGTKTYRFYGPDPRQPNRSHEFRPQLGGDYFLRYYEEMDELAKDIATVLRELAELTASGGAQPGAAAQAQLAVYVAETTSDLDDKLGEVRRDLKDRGYLVLPSADLPYRAKDYRDKVRECLKRAALSVHLVGAQYGFVPEGEASKSNVWLQHDLAIERGADAGFERLIWMPPGLSPSDERQRRFVDYLREDPAAQKGADLLETKLEDLKTVIQEKLRQIGERNSAKQRRPQAAAAAQRKAAGEPLRIYLICDPLDRQQPQLVALRRFLLAKGYEPMLPSESEDEAETLADHIDNLELCDACLVYYGAGSARWFDAKLKDFRKILSRRPQPVLAKAVYIAAPETPAKAEVETNEALVLKGGAAFAPETLAPFLGRLGSAASA